MSNVEAHAIFPLRLESIILKRFVCHVVEQIVNFSRNFILFNFSSILKLKNRENRTEIFSCKFRVISKNNVGGTSKNFHHRVSIVGIS